MKKRYKSGLVISALTTAALLVGANAFADHPAVPLLNASGVAIGQNEAYSPKATCGACHDQSSTNVDDGVLGVSGEGIGSYDGGGTTKLVAKSQGVMNETSGDAEWVSYNVTAYEHGFVTGRHSQQGRNEEYGNHLRHALHGKFWASSPGMFGKY